MADTPSNGRWYCPRADETPAADGAHWEFTSGSYARTAAGVRFRALFAKASRMMAEKLLAKYPTGKTPGSAARDRDRNRNFASRARSQSVSHKWYRDP